MYAEVILNINNKNVDRIFHYFIPEYLQNEAKIGCRVSIPFGRSNKENIGFIIGFSETPDCPVEKVKPIAGVLDKTPVISLQLIELAKWMKDKYYTTLSNCLQCIIPKIVNDKTVRYAYINYENENIEQLMEETIKKKNYQSRVIELLKRTNGLPVTEIKMLLEIAESPIKTLEKKNIIKICDVEVNRDVLDIEKYSPNYKFIPTQEQLEAINFLKDKLNDENKRPVLIHGVTGSGKTEVYLQIIEEVIKDGKQAIILVPEISLTPQTVDRFIGRFGNFVSVTHSRLSDGERYDQWKKAKNGQISIMIGPRSAIFTPFNNLGCIIIDEEHENTYKSETTPKYDTKEVAVKLSELTGTLVVLGSATPIVESYYRAKTGVYDLVTIENRVNNQFPDIEIVDMKDEFDAGNRSIFSRTLFTAIAENIENKKQTILFLNRRGHSTFVSCRKCGFVMKCDNCNVNYTYHLHDNKLVCHYCNTVIETPEICPQCGLKYIKYFGVGTQKIEEEATRLLPNAKILRMDLDTTSKKNSHEIILKQFARGGADILIGTQMIAKGLDFPNVSLVGVIAADLSINAGDFRCAETSFQLLTQVAGRAGRADVKGRVYIQTYQPEHYSIIYAKENNYIDFYNHEIELRRQMMYPPYSHIFFIMFTGEDEREIIIKLHKLMEIMRYYNQKTNFELMGPTSAVISKIRNQYRWKIIVKGNDEERVKNFVIYCVDRLKREHKLEGININLTLNPSFIQ